ncbi:MAG: tetratricopeptide repeat protein [Planctomycetes bacterium]|nr:tetratricopeptide repeat protein [Planctomycetota bacterium]
MADDAPRASLPPEDLQFAQLVVGQGICSRQAVDECLSFLGRLMAEGVTPLPRLGELLVRKGLLSADRLDATLRPAAGGAELEKIRDLPPDVAGAAADPANNLGKYVKVDRLGAGGMGEVWRGWDRELRRWVALKFLHYEDPGQLARFRREAQTAAALNHPHIASVYEVGETKGRPFIAMQYIAGRTLDSVPRNNPRALIELVRDAALAIHYAHEQGVVHRDLKPANLMVETAGGKQRLFVMDFGLAKATAVDSSLSLSGQVLGTPAYMAPEQASGDSARVSARSDVYALGATLYELFADRPPFQETEVYALLKKVVDEDPVLLGRRNPRVERELETIVMKCLEKDPAQRYATARELAEDLDRWLKGEAIRAHPPSAVYRLRKFVGRRKAILAVAAAGVAVAAVLLAATLREKSEKEALRELGELRANMLRVKEWIRQDSRSAAEIRDALEHETRRITDFIGRHPRLPQAYFVRAQGRLLQGRLGGAELDLDEALRREPRFAPAWSLLGRLKLERYMLRLYSDPNSDQSHVAERATPLLKEAEAAFGKGGAEESASLEKWGLSRLAEDAVNDRLIEAFRLYYVKNDEDGGRGVLNSAFRQAPSEEYCRWMATWTPDLGQRLKWLEKGLHIAPHSAATRADLACYWHQQKNWDATIAEATRAIDVNPSSAVAYAVRAAAWLEKGEAARSLDDCSRGIDADPLFGVLYATRSGARLTLEDYEGAARDAGRALELDPTYALAYANRAGARISAGDAAGALKDCNRAIELDPKLVVALSNRSGAQVLLGNLDAAIEDADAAIRLQPGFALAYMNRGTAHYRKDKIDDAIRDYGRAVDLDPHLVLALVNRAGMYLVLERWDDALRDCDRALAQNPKSALAWSNRGFALLSKGDHAGAAADATKAIDFGGTLPEPYIVRGEARRALKDRAGALADFEKALKFAPPDWLSRAEVEQTLKELRAEK